MHFLSCSQPHWVHLLYCYGLQVVDDWHDLVSLLAHWYQQLCILGCFLGQLMGMRGYFFGSLMSGHWYQSVPLLIQLGQLLGVSECPKGFPLGVLRSLFVQLVGQDQIWKY